MVAIRREFEIEKSFRREERNPWKRLLWILGGGLAFTTLALLLLQAALTKGPSGSPEPPRTAWIVPPAELPLFIVPSGGARMPLHSGASLMLAASGDPLHLQAEGDPADHEALLLAEDDFGRLTTVWPPGRTLRGGVCPGDCSRLDLVIGPKALPAGNPHLVLWIGPGPIDASSVEHLGRGAPPAIAGSRTSAWLNLER